LFFFSSLFFAFSLQQGRFAYVKGRNPPLPSSPSAPPLSFLLFPRLLLTKIVDAVHSCSFSSLSLVLSFFPLPGYCDVVLKRKPVFLFPLECSSLYSFPPPPFPSGVSFLPLTFFPFPPLPQLSKRYSRGLRIVTLNRSKTSSPLLLS